MATVPNAPCALLLQELENAPPALQDTMDRPVAFARNAPTLPIVCLARVPTNAQHAKLAITPPALDVAIVLETAMCALAQLLALNALMDITGTPL